MKNEFRLTSKQNEAYKALTNESTHTVFYPSGIANGSSFFSAYWLLNMAFAKPNSSYLFLTTRIIDFKMSTLRTILDVAERMGVSDKVSFDLKRNILSAFKSNIFIRAYGETEEEVLTKYASSRFDAAVMEKANDTFFESYQSTLIAVRGGKILVTAVPGSSWITDKFYNPWKRGELQRVEFIEASPFDNEFLPEEYLSKLTEENLGKEAYERRVKINWNF